MNRTRMVAIALVWACVTPPALANGQEEPQKFAFLVGINDYENSEIIDLKGCVNDVDDMRRLLTENFEFPNHNVTCLTSATDLKPTKDNILRGITEHLINQTKPGREDIVVFYFSGHGSQVDDQNGDERFDGKDETLVPCDSREDGKFDITDDEIHQKLKLLHDRTPNLTFFLDSCHSGSGIRGMGTAKQVAIDTRQQPADRQPAGTDRSDSARGVGDQGIAPDDLDYVLIAGCESDQVSFEIKKGGVKRGALTHYFTNAVRKAINDRATDDSPSPGASANTKVSVTYQNIIDQVRIGVGSENDHQVPQIEGKRANNFVFSDESSIPVPFVIANRSGDSVVLSAGKVQGLTMGSTFDLYPPATNQFDEESDRVLQVQVTSVGNFSSTASPINGSGSIEDVMPASQAVERMHVYAGDGTFPVYFLQPGDESKIESVSEAFVAKENSETLQDIANKISGSEFHTAVPTIDEARLLIGQVGQRIKMFQSSGRKIVTADYPIDHDDLIDKVMIDQIEHWTKWYNIRGIENHRVGKIKVQTWITPTTDEFRDGDTCEIHVKNTGRKALYCAVLIISDDGSVNPIYPPGGDGEKLGRGEDIDFGIQLSVTDGYPQVTDIVKVIATDTQQNFSFLAQGSRNVLPPKSKNSSLMRLLRDAACLRQDADPRFTTRQATLLPVEDWCTDSVIYTVSR